MSVSPSTQGQDQGARWVRQSQGSSKHASSYTHELINNASCLVLGQEAMTWNLEPFIASLFGFDGRHPLD